MANNLTDITVIRSYFASIWDANIPVVYDNETPNLESVTVWARLSVSPGHQKVRSVFPPSYDQLGRVYLQVFMPRGSYDDAGWNLAEQFGEAFREHDLDNYRVRMGTPDYRSQDATDADPYYMIFVSIPYQAIH